MGSMALFPSEQPKPMKMRWYQQEAIDGFYNFIRDPSNKRRNPLIVVPTGGGKTPIISKIINDVAGKRGRRVWVTTFVKELIVQGVDTLQANCPKVKFGIYSAGMNRKESKGVKVVYGQIQSMYKNTAKICEEEPPALVIVDEAQTVPPDGEGMYQQMLQTLEAINPDCRLLGLTATPFRMKTGFICNDDGPFHEICYRVGVNPLIEDGFLSPLIGKAGLMEEPDFSKLKITANEYNKKAMEDAMTVDSLVVDSVKEIVGYTRDQNRKTLIFCTGVKHMDMVTNELSKYVPAEQIAAVTGETPKAERDRIIQRYKDGKFQYLLNIMVLTVGFDCPDIDCVAVMRPTLSPGLWAQMIGRGFRVAEGKTNCLILDYGRNIITHGPLDEMDITWTKLEKGEKVTKQKVCPQCGDFVSVGVTECPACNFVWERMERGFSHDREAHDESPLGDPEKPKDDTLWMTVHRINVIKHRSKKGDDIMRVDYESDLGHVVSEYICIEHTGFARGKAESWWECRSKHPCPDSVDEAIMLFERGMVAWAREIKWKKNGNFNEIVWYDLENRPEFEADVAEQVSRMIQQQRELDERGEF